jgi:hypothetical protein
LNGGKGRIAPTISGIPSFFIVLHLAVVCHDLFGPIMLLPAARLSLRSDSLGSDEPCSISD